MNVKKFDGTFFPFPVTVRKSDVDQVVSPSKRKILRWIKHKRRHTSKRKYGYVAVM